VLAVVVHAQTGTVALQSPLNSSISTIPGFLAFALKALVKIALPIISVFIVYSGFLFVTAQGNSEKISTARMNFLYVIIGSILILGAWVLATIIGGTVADIVGK
jgi:hypothetical protein